MFYPSFRHIPSCQVNIIVTNTIWDRIVFYVNYKQISSNLQTTVIVSSCDDTFKCGPTGLRSICASHLNLAPLSFRVGVNGKVDKSFTGCLVFFKLFGSMISKTSDSMILSPLYHFTVRFWTGAILGISQVMLYSSPSTIIPLESAVELIWIFSGNAEKKKGVIRYQSY